MFRKTRMGFYGFCMVRKAPGLMEMGPREATQGELQGELLRAATDTAAIIT